MKISIEKPGTPVELVHAGVKGMKWGIRKERTSSNQLRKQAKARLYKSAVESGSLEARLNKIFDVSPITMDDYNRMSTRRTSIPAGTTLYRLTKDPSDTSLGGFTYVSTSKKDATLYRGLLPAERIFDPIRRSDYKQRYEVVLKTKKTLRGPSEKERFDILADLIDDKTAYKGKMSLREYLRKGKVITRKEAKNASSVEIALKVHRVVHTEMWKRTPISTSYMAAVEKKGFDMLTDDNDIGLVAKNPKIIINPQASTELKKIQPLTNDDILNAQINLRFPKQKSKK